MIAVHNNEMEMVTALLEYGANPNHGRRRNSSTSALMIAISKDKPALVRSLLSHGADVHRAWFGGSLVLPLVKALQWRKGSDVLSVLLEFGADPLHEADHHGPALYHACDEGTAKLLCGKRPASSCYDLWLVGRNPA
jgi:hypothetical protein